ncbi:MAG TPA: hypothetical protein EYO33_29180, partial [Phycisphaerales bacterium]|nr:hypothetical protein [Phycisphaerales bacterium]
MNDGDGVNAAEVLAATGDSLADQQQNFANWFSYYRRRHQTIRSAIGRSVEDLENMRLGAMGINSGTRYDMSNRMYSVDSGRSSFLDDLYNLYVSGSYSGQGTPNRLALQHAGREYSKTSVRGDLECRKNFSLLFTDGYASSHPNSTDAGNADSAAGEPYASSHSNTLGDIAYYYYEGLRNNDGSIIGGGDTPTPSECGTGSEEDWMDCNKEYHMNTYTVGLGMEGQKFAGKTHFKVQDAYEDAPDWSSLTNMNAQDSVQIDDLYHAAVNGKGEYFDAQSTQELVLALQGAVDLMQADVGSGSGINFNTASLAEGGAVFSAAFTSVEWTGDLRAENVDEDGDIGSQIWSAKTQLDGRDLASDPRLVLTYGMDNGNQGGTTFEWDNLTAAQKADLQVAAGSDAEGLAKKRIDFLLGEDVESYDGITFRNRKSRMGAIVNSS